MQNRNIFYALGVITFFAFIYFLFLSPPAGFPAGGIVKIDQGKSLRGVSLQLKEAHVIRSRTAFEVFVILFGRETRVISTDYYFEGKLPVFEVARRIALGEHHIIQAKVTIPEGFNNTEMAEAFAAKLIYFNKDNFLTLTKDKQGRLFPDTYYFLITDAETDVIKSLSTNFEQKISPLRSDIVTSGKTEQDIITMASLIEGEAKGDADRAIISGILWKRIKIGMPLQVDAASETYKTRGLPKSPISNPGLAAIKAAIHPESSPYLYYLHDKDGVVHYAKTFAEHRLNVAKYLK